MEGEITAKEDYLKTLERIKKQYQEYIEISEFYNLPTTQNIEETGSINTHNYPVTTNTLKFKKNGIVE